jgi:hypothetical protein
VFAHLQNFRSCRRPELEELDRMLAPSPEGFFEDTPENAIALFKHVFQGTGFDIQQLKGLPVHIKQGVLEQYYEKPRTAQDYCNLVWNRHLASESKVAVHKKHVNESKRAIIARDSKGRPHEEAELTERVSYAELMQDLLYLPKRQSTFQQFSVKAHKKLEKHVVTLRLPLAIELDCYHTYTQRFEKIMKQGLELP